MLLNYTMFTPLEPMTYCVFHGHDIIIISTRMGMIASHRVYWWKPSGSNSNWIIAPLPDELVRAGLCEPLPVKEEMNCIFMPLQLDPAFHAVVRDQLPVIGHWDIR